MRNRQIESTLGQDSLIAERRNKVMLLAQDEHLSLRDIALRLNVSRETVRRDYWHVMNELAEERQTLGKAVLQDHLQLVERRIEKISTTLNNGLQDEKLEAMLIRWMDQRAKLLNLYPTQDMTATIRHEHYVMQFDATPADDTIPGSASAIEDHVSPEDDTA